MLAARSCARVDLRLLCDLLLYTALLHLCWPLLSPLLVLILSDDANKEAILFAVLFDTVHSKRPLLSFALA
jgi:hypothetical protein